MSIYGNQLNEKKIVNKNYYMTMMEASILQEAAENNTYIVEEAKFNFLPRFKEKDEYKELYNTIKDAEDCLNSTNYSPETGINKFGKIILRFFDLYQNVGSLLILPTCIAIAPIPSYLLGRLIEWGIQVGKEAVADNYAKKCIDSFEKMKKNEKNESKRKEYQKQIDKIKKMKEALKKS